MYRHTSLSGRALRMAQVILVVAPAFIIFVYNQAGAGPLATLQSWVKVFPQIDTVNTHGAIKAKNFTGKGAGIAAFQIGALIGALPCTFISERLGRRKTIFCGAILTMIGQLLQTSAFSLIQFTVGRIIVGMGIGQFPFGSSAAENRGKHVIADGIFMCLGYALCNWVDFGFSRLPHQTTGQWHGPLAISFFPSLVILASVFIMPESPRWLVRVNRVEEASASLPAYKGVAPDDEAVKAEIAGIELSLEATAKSKGGTPKDVLKGR
ncbi:hexose carrier protein [Penicillium subrubescens]|uniref:Sugar transporter STL1 n=1 Tax=Penicillium subrubescens TaxID=1316194 RepID=A0A1Q5TBN3_9EURO|nr:hexose carrier protein [Penicillium subrubescens]KAJ5892166.1 hexose carrier protein [Penicillium subrubescens]OKO97649.1 Sugar transporter STL1 [Penicillium subrubescens]